MGNHKDDPEEDLNSMIEAWERLYQYFPFEIKESQVESSKEHTEVIADLTPLSILEEHDTQVTSLEGDTEKQRHTRSILSYIMKAFHPSVAAGVYVALHTGDIRLLCVVLLFFLLLIPKLLKGS